MFGHHKMIFRIGSGVSFFLKMLAFFAALVAVAILSAYLFLYFSLPDVTSLATSNPSTTALIELRKGEAKIKNSDFKLQWEWIPLSKISPVLVHAIIRTEDFTFWTHTGIEWSQIKRALSLIWRRHRIITGASTITQQVARNLYLSLDRTLLRKSQEVLIAFELEKHLSKERILEIYLNIAEWGDGIFGIEAASLHWFNCHADKLNPREAIHLALALPNPHLRNPSKLSTRLTLFGNRLLLRLAQEGLISDNEALKFLTLPKKYKVLNEEDIIKLSL